MLGGESGGFKPAPTGGNGCPPATLPTGGRTRGSAPTAGHSRIPLPPVKGGGSNPRLQAGTAVGQQHCLWAGGHVGPPLRLVTRASPSRPSMEGGFQTRAYRRERLSASTIAYRRADTWVRPYGWSRAHPPPARQWRAGFKPAPTGGNGCPPAPSPTGGRTRGSAPTAGHAHPSPARQGRAGFKPAPTGGNGCPGRLPAGGHVGPPLRLVTRASPSRPSIEGRTRATAGTVGAAYRRADTWVRPYGWSRAHPSPARQGRAGFRTRASGGNGCWLGCYGPRRPPGFPPRIEYGAGFSRERRAGLERILRRCSGQARYERGWLGCCGPRPAGFRPRIEYGAGFSPE